MGFHHNDIQWGALPSGICHCDVQFGRTFNLAKLEQDDANAGVTWGTPPNYWSAADFQDYQRATWKVTPRTSLPNGTLHVTVYIVSAWAAAGSNVGMSLIRSPFDDPDLTQGTSSQSVYTGNTYTFMTPVDSRAFQTGYFGMSAGWYWWTVSAKITKLQWRHSSPFVYTTIWEEGLDGAFNHSCVRFG